MMVNDVIPNEIMRIPARVVYPMIGLEKSPENPIFQMDDGGGPQFRKAPLIYNPQSLSPPKWWIISLRKVRVFHWTRIDQFFFNGKQPLDVQKIVSNIFSTMGNWLFLTSWNKPNWFLCNSAVFNHLLSFCRFTGKHSAWWSLIYGSWWCPPIWKKYISQLGWFFPVYGNIIKMFQTN